MIPKKHKAAIFDLDGVLADTARFHYLAWKEMADRLGFPFTPEDGERIKGVARMEALDVVLRAGNMQHWLFARTEGAHGAGEKRELYLTHQED